MVFKSLTFFITLLVVSLAQRAKYNRPDSPEVVAEWKQLDYDFPNDNERQAALGSGVFVPGSGIPIEVAVTPNYERIFVTIPRFGRGIPFTLATINSNSLSYGQNGPLLQAYPAYSWHNDYRSNCNGIVSAFRVAMTECNQMWVIDSGIIAGEQVCPPKLLLFDLSNDELIHRYEFETGVFTPAASLLITPLALVMDPRGNCQQTMVYIADVTQHGLIVYDYQQNRAWRAENKWMYPNPNYGLHTIAGTQFTLMDGMFALNTDRKNLFFHPLASPDEFSVPLSVLNNATNFANGVGGQENAFRKLGSRGSPCAAEAIDSCYNLYCVTFNPIRLLGWNVKSGDYSSRNFFEIPVDTRLLEFVSGMKVVKNPKGKEELWMMSNRYQKVASGTLNPNDINFRITKLQLEDTSRDLHHKLIFSRSVASHNSGI